MSKHSEQTNRTKKRIEEAFFKIAEEKGLDAVNVRSLSLEAGISRGTFYLHYLDVYDLMDKLEEEIISGLEALPVQQKSEQLIYKAEEAEGQPFPSIVQFFRYIDEHHRFFKLWLHHDHSKFGNKLSQWLQTRIDEKMPQRRPDTGAAAVPTDFMMTYFHGAFFDVIRHWLDTNRELPLEEAALVLTRLIRNGPLQTALGNRE
ncbi:TetR/AcrR family transcriptional regulator [Paenibacillus radicis (ex Gao et al. 2016)]|uniref:TetR family transcriptional regulator n=1 Tax=Paenibacillus radicis (ex Gao et al. 2016) TaxID=1737354 RepID=A0A917GRB8_9BACL|nr:TetR/AcrR family transcriptional regulator C-terminal domain-containing protein [Paenibacillus radicis (ex Gao et al. 2016)]GGG54359.1 TetR family transcriptional regulator [Paenibacillus radicis (ex Gao et al. 2016)]